MRGQRGNGTREDLGSYLEESGHPGGLWTEEGLDLTQGLTGALWPQQKGQTLGGKNGSSETQAEAPALIQASDNGGLPGRGRFYRYENPLAIVSLVLVGECKVVTGITQLLLGWHWPSSILLSASCL